MHTLERKHTSVRDLNSDRSNVWLQRYNLICRGREAWKETRKRFLPGRYCDGKVKDIYKSKELWRGPESIYTLKQGLCIAHDNHPEVIEVGHFLRLNHMNALNTLRSRPVENVRDRARRSEY